MRPHSALRAPPPFAHVVAPDPSLRARYAARIEPFRKLYRDLRASFASLAAQAAREEVAS